MEFEDFEDLVFRINGIITQQPVANRGNYWKMRIGGDLDGVDTPEAEDKPGLLKLVWERAKALEEVRDIGLATATSVNLIHAFVDGNGRTSRLIYELLANGYRGSEEDRQRIRSVLEDKGGIDTHDLAVPPFLKRLAWTRIIEDSGGYLVPAGVSFGLMPAAPTDTVPMVISRSDLTQDERDELVRLISSQNKTYESQLHAIWQAFATSGRLQEVLKEYYDPDGNPKRITIDGKLIAEKAASSEIAAFQSGYGEAKRKYSEAVIELLTDQGDAGITIRSNIHTTLS